MSFPCQLFEQDIHHEHNYDPVSNRIHFQNDLFFQIVPFSRRQFSPLMTELELKGHLVDD